MKNWFQEKIVENVYRAFYAAYYYLHAVEVINDPHPIEVPANAIACSPELDSQARRQHSFLFAQVTAKKWAFYKRNFAFREKGTKQWFDMPSLTPWSHDQFTGTKFGLNHDFVSKHQGKKLEFMTW